MILAGDVGGTKTNLAIYSPEKGALAEIYTASFSSRDFTSLTLLVRRFLEQARQVETVAESLAAKKMSHACLGVAGPVRDRRVQVTNLPWWVDAAVLEKELNLAVVSLINDVEANGYGIATLRPGEWVELNPMANLAQRGNRALIAAGTGLGEAGLIWNGKIHVPFATEGGHCSFAPNDAIGDELLSFLRKERGHVSWERVLSGLGISNLYRFFRERSGLPEPAWLREKLRTGDLNAVVSEAGLTGSDPVCVQTLDLFVSNYGAEAGNLALKMLSLGGLYIGGGIAPKILPKMQSDLFLRAFTHKGRMTPLLESMSISVILNPRTALQGAGWVAQAQQDGQSILTNK